MPIGFRYKGLEAFHRGNQWSVWVNGNWRVTFRFTEAGVELVDYRDYR